MYSEEWKQVIKTYEAYKESLSVFRTYDKNTADLSKSLRAIRQLDCHYALEALQYARQGLRYAFGGLVLCINI